MRLNVNVSFDFKKTKHSPNLLLNLLSSKYVFFFFFVQKMDLSTLRLICIEELSKLKRSLGLARLLKSADFIKFKQR